MPALLGDKHYYLELDWGNFLRSRKKVDVSILSGETLRRVIIVVPSPALRAIKIIIGLIDGALFFSLRGRGGEGVKVVGDWYRLLFGHMKAFLFWPGGSKMVGY